MTALPFSQEKKRVPLRVRRRRVRAYLILAGIVALGGVVWGIGWLSYHPRLSIHTIEIFGTDQVRPEVIEAEVETMLFSENRSFISTHNIFFYPRENIEHTLLERIPRLKSAVVTKDSFFGQILIVTIEEREVFARWCGDACYFMDRTGIIFAPTASSTDSLHAAYTFRGGTDESALSLGQAFLVGQLPEVITLIASLEQAGFTPEEVRVESTQDYSIGLAERFEVRLSFGSDVQKIVRDLELILSSDDLRGKESRLEYVDLRFGNRAYFKFRD